MNDTPYVIAAFAGALYLLKRSKKQDIIDDTESFSILLEPILTITLEEFRSECMADGRVACDWTTLETRLEDQTVSGLWWKLTTTERRSIAKKAVESEMLYQVHWQRSGLKDCAGGEGEYKRITCMNNAMIRYLRFGSMDGIETEDSDPSQCYYKRSAIDTTEDCYVREHPYNLPCKMAMCMNHPGDEGFGHMMCAIQVQPSIDRLDDWVIFQYSAFDIQPGDSQMPYGTHLSIDSPVVLGCRMYEFEKTVAEFDI